MTENDNNKNVWPVSLISQSIREVQKVYPTAILKSLEIDMGSSMQDSVHVKLVFSILTSTARWGE